MATVKVISSGIRGPRGPQGSNGTADNRGGFSLNYSGSVVVNASWNAGNPQKVASTIAPHVTASGYNEWHFSDIPRSFTGQYISATEEDIFSILTGSIVSSSQALVRIWDDEDPSYEAFYINSGSASITNAGNVDGGDLTLNLKWIGGRGFGTTTNQVWPNGTNPGNTNVSFELIGGIPGEKGDKGDQGDIGLTGPQGSDGPTGPEGPTGFQGVQGSQGPSGSGSAGPQGPQGPQGNQGNQGPTVNTGSFYISSSVILNDITFNLGDGSTHSVLVDTGSSGGGGVGTLQQVTDLGNTTTNDVTVADITGSRAIFEDSKGNTIIGRDIGNPVNAASKTNILIGSSSMQDGQTIISNVVIGTNNAKNLQYGVNNVLLGSGVMQFSSGSSTSDGNIALGPGALSNVNEINNNIALGHNSGNYLNGDRNILVGYATAGGGLTGDKNIIIGDNAGIYPTNGNYENAIVIGAYNTSYGSNYFNGGSNTVMIGNPGIERNTLWGELDVTGSISSSADVISREDVIAGRNSNFGVILTSPNNTKYRIVVDNSGNLSTTPI